MQPTPPLASVFIRSYLLQSTISRGLSLAICLAAFSCAESASISEEERGGGPYGKADVTAGPIEDISCSIEQSFVRRGSFATLQVKAKDADGALSRNYQLVTEPKIGTRVVQRDQVIFDLDGLYTVHCCALDAQRCDQVAVRVGEIAPALAVSVDPFTENVALLKGHAQDRSGRPAKVSVNGNVVSSDESGHFEARVASPTGLNHYEVVAVGSEGEQSTRHAWTIGGPFNGIDELDPSAIRLRLSQDSYPLMSQILTAYFIKLADDASNSEDLSVPQTGSTLGYEYEVTPSRLGLGETQVRLAAGAQVDELVLMVSLENFQAFADSQTRFGGGDWKHREVVISADLYIEVPFTLHSQGIDIGQVKTDVNDLQVEISDMPGFIEGILEVAFDRSIQKKLVKMVESVGDQGLSEVLTQFEFNKSITLPEPFTGDLDLTGRVSELQVDEQGVTLGIGLSVDGETDPARLDAPGPLMTSVQGPSLNNGAAYELAFHLDALNRILFSAWQTGSLDMVSMKDQPFGERDDVFGDQSLALFVTPMIPPVARVGDRSGELIIDLGALRIDGVLQSDLAVLNCALEAGASIRVLLSSDQVALTSSAALKDLKADVLIAPAGWETEPTRELVARIIEEDIAPKYAELLQSTPIIEADLSALGLSEINALITRSLSVSTTMNSLTMSADLELK